MKFNNRLFRKPGSLWYLVLEKLKDALRIKENIVITILIVVGICILSIRYPASSEIEKLIIFILAIVGALCNLGKA